MGYQGTSSDSEAHDEMETPEDFLRFAMAAEDPETRRHYAYRGLAFDADTLTPDTHLLLLRQVYVAALERSALSEASEVAASMIAVGRLADIAYHDAARVSAAKQDWMSAIRYQRLALRHSPVDRRSFHAWSLATWLQFAGQLEDAVIALRRGERWAKKDRTLLRAHRAWLMLQLDQADEGLQETFEALERAPCGKGYGRFVLGMLAHQMGYEAKATVYLQAFLRRNANVDLPKALTLAHELRLARETLVEIAAMT